MFLMVPKWIPVWLPGVQVSYPYLAISRQKAELFCFVEKETSSHKPQADGTLRSVNRATPSGRVLRTRWFSGHWLEGMGDGGWAWVADSQSSRRDC